MSGIECAMFGTLGRDAEMKQSKNDRQYLRLRLRVGDGDSAQWVSASVFDSDAIAVAAKLVKDARVYLEGRLSLDTWTGRDGAERHDLAVMSFHCRLAQIGKNKPPRDRQTNKSTSSPAGAGDFHDDEIPI